MRQEFDGKFSHHHELPEGGAGQVAQWWWARSALACPPQTALGIPANFHCPLPRAVLKAACMEPHIGVCESQEEMYGRKTGLPQQALTTSSTECGPLADCAPWSISECMETWRNRDLTCLMWLMLSVQLWRIF